MMRLLTAAVALACLNGLTSAADKRERTFAVMHFTNNEIVRCREDPIISPGKVSGHVHSVMGGSNFGMNANADSLKASTCSNALVKGDFSNYWVPSLYFHNKDNNSFVPVEMFYMNVYYFFEPTSDDIVAFPSGLQVVSGNPSLRVPPATKGNINLDPSNGPINAIQWTCPRSGYTPPSWPANSDGTMGGIQDTNDLAAGAGFPFQHCDGYASPLRMDVHFPSCYNPAAGLSAYESNMAFPSLVPGTPYQNCPKGWIHVPHLFYEVYWNANLLWDGWNVDGAYEPFVLSNGDSTGYGSHGDFFAAWDEPLLQNIIDNCNAGDSGMDRCPGINGLNSGTCTTTCPVDEQIDGVLSALPGNNPLTGWYNGKGAVAAAPPAAAAAPLLAAASPPAVSSPVAAPSSMAAPPPAPPVPVTSTMTTQAPVVVDQASSSTSLPPTTTFTSTSSSVTTTTAFVTVHDPSAQSSSPAAAAGPGLTETVTDYVTVTVTTNVPAATVQSLAVMKTRPTIDGWASVGCYSDADVRVLTGNQLPNLGEMTNEKCTTFCADAGFSIAGTEFGEQCFCGKTIASSKLPDSSCDMACAGNADDTCGGHWALSVFKLSATSVPGR